MGHDQFGHNPIVSGGKIFTMYNSSELSRLMLRHHLEVIGSSTEASTLTVKITEGDSTPQVIEFLIAKKNIPKLKILIARHNQAHVKLDDEFPDYKSAYPQYSSYKRFHFGRGIGAIRQSSWQFPPEIKCDHPHPYDPNF